MRIDRQEFNQTVTDIKQQIQAERVQSRKALKTAVLRWAPLNMDFYLGSHLIDQKYYDWGNKLSQASKLNDHENELFAEGFARKLNIFFLLDHQYHPKHPVLNSINFFKPEDKTLMMTLNMNLVDQMDRLVENSPILRQVIAESPMNQDYYEELLMNSFICGATTSKLITDNASMDIIWQHINGFRRDPIATLDIPSYAYNRD